MYLIVFFFLANIVSLVNYCYGKLFLSSNKHFLPYISCSTDYVADYWQKCFFVFNSNGGHVGFWRLVKIFNCFELEQKVWRILSFFSFFSLKQRRVAGNLVFICVSWSTVRQNRKSRFCLFDPVMLQQNKAVSVVLQAELETPKQPQNINIFTQMAFCFGCIFIFAPERKFKLPWQGNIFLDVISALAQFLER